MFPWCVGAAFKTTFKPHFKNWFILRPCLFDHIHVKTWLTKFEQIHVTLHWHIQIHDATSTKLWLGRRITKPIKWQVRPAKTQISLGIRPVWSESSLCALWVAKDPMLLHVNSEDSDQTGRMPRLIRVFAGRTIILLVLLWGGSFYKIKLHLLIQIINRTLKPLTRFLKLIWMNKWLNKK